MMVEGPRGHNIMYVVKQSKYGDVVLRMVKSNSCR